MIFMKKFTELNQIIEANGLLIPYELGWELAPVKRQPTRETSAGLSPGERPNSSLGDPGPHSLLSFFPFPPILFLSCNVDRKLLISIKITHWY